MQRSPHIDHYKVLGIDRTADLAAVKRAYRQAAKRYHPDRNGPVSSAEAFHAVCKAYEVLRDPRSRAWYDLRSASAPAPARPGCSAPAFRAPVPQAPTGRPAPRWAYVGLHVTGLVFGVLMVLGIVMKVMFDDLHPLALVLAVPGMVVIPDSFDGLLARDRRR